ncbi:M23 family metallopeptidase [Streptomyces sp. NPDC018045]|uniref:M23 family metallopeptidase n=1 Tax=Streptomyces sp. NPDC018045 TaxID=3365037 RepID=UPI003798C037
MRVTLSLVIALTGAAGTASAVGGAAHAGAPAVAPAPAEPSAATPLPSLPAPRSPSPARGHGTDRLAEASLEVLRLGRAVHRTGRSYARTVREVRAGRARAARLHAALLRERRTAAELRRLAGRVAGAQYRSGSRLPFELGAKPRQGARAGQGDHEGQGARAGHGAQARVGAEAVLSAYRKAERRQRLLAARAREALRRSRSLEADSAAVLSRSAALDAHRSRLDAERRHIGRRLDVVRGRLQRLSRQASRAGRCGPSGPVTAAARRSEPVVPPVPGRGWTRPVERYVLSAGFGGSGRRWAHGHTGQDFAVPVGTPVRSVGWGRVTSLTCGDAFGISMVVQHGAGAFSQYAHLSAALARPGQRVRPGQQIALSGTTGNSTGPHLHFEVRRTPRMGSGVDPVPWLASRGVRLR